MRNILIIDVRNNFQCSNVQYTADGENSVIIHILSNHDANVKIEILDGETISINNIYFVWMLEESQYIGMGQLKFRIVNKGQTSDYYILNKVPVITGNLTVYQKDNFQYEIVDVQPIEIPIAGENTLGIVKGGGNIKIQRSGDMYLSETVVAEKITNQELEDLLT